MVTSFLPNEKYVVKVAKNTYNNNIRKVTRIMKNTTKTTKPLNEKQSAFINALETNPEGLTLSEASEIAGLDIKSGSINSLTSRGLIQKVGERKVAYTSYRNVTVYGIVDDETDDDIDFDAVVDDEDAPASEDASSAEITK